MMMITRLGVGKCCWRVHCECEREAKLMVVEGK